MAKYFLYLPVFQLSFHVAFKVSNKVESNYGIVHLHIQLGTAIGTF